MQQEMSTGRLPADTADRIFAVIFLAVGYAFWKMMISIFHFESSVSMFTMFYVAVVSAYCYSKKLKFTKEMLFWTGIVLSIGVPYRFWCAMPGLQFLVLVFTAGYWTHMVTGSLIGGGKTSEWIVADMWNTMAALPFTNMDKQVRVLFGMLPRHHSRKKVVTVLWGVVLAVPMVMFVMPLLMQADRGFAKFISGLRWSPAVGWQFDVMEFVIAILISSYLYGIVYGSRYQRIDTAKEQREVMDMAKNIRFIPNLAVNTAVTIVSALYLLFIAMQSHYFFSAFAGIRPEEYTYAEYARQGFFELCAVAAINIVIFLLANIFSRQSYQEQKASRICNTVLAVLTLVLIGTAMSKMGMYIWAYGLTVKRVLTSVFMLWMAIVFALIIRKQKASIPLMRWAVLAGAVLFAALCVFPIEKMI